MFRQVVRTGSLAAILLALASAPARAGDDWREEMRERQERQRERWREWREDYEDRLEDQREAYEDRLEDQRERAEKYWRRQRRWSRAYPRYGHGPAFVPSHAPYHSGHGCSPFNHPWHAAQLYDDSFYRRPGGIHLSGPRFSIVIRW